jgi:hypothetical protein
MPIDPRAPGPGSDPTAAGSAAPAVGERAAVRFDDLPPGEIVRAFGVEYGLVRPPSGGDLYVTRYGWPWLPHLLPSSWYEDQWYARSGERLPGASGNVYRVRTRPVGGRSIEVVVKFSRIAQDVTVIVPTTFPDDVSPEDIANARYNSPMEEFGLVMELRRGAFGPHDLRLRTQRPLAIYAPPEEFPLWQLGRDRSSFHAHGRRLAEDQENAIKAIELDIRRIYVLLYGWIRGADAEQEFDAGDIDVGEFAALTPRVVGELRAKGFRVLDCKPKHFILRKRRAGGQPLRRRGQLVYGLVDFEFLQRTPEHQLEFRAAQHERYWQLQSRSEEPAPSPLPSHLRRTTIFGTTYVFGESPNGGKLWVVGHGAELFDYFLPDRWRRTARIKLSPANEVYRTRTRDNIHVVYRRSRVGTRPFVDPLTGWGKSIREHGYNSPFEEVTIAERLRQMGIATTRPRAIYRTSHPSTKAGYLRDERRFADHADLAAPGAAPEPVLSPRHDYYTIWDCFRGADPCPPAAPDAAPPATDLQSARESGLLAAAAAAGVLASARDRLARTGFGGDGIEEGDLLVFPRAGGELLLDDQGRVTVALCVDALTAYEYGLLDDHSYRAVIEHLTERLRAVDCEKLDVGGSDLLLSMDPDGRFTLDAHGGILATLCNFELIRGLYRPIR